MKVAFYIPNKNIEDADLATVHRGNPGIGGTEYAILALSHFLSQHEDITVFTYSNVALKNYAADTVKQIADNLQAALRQALADEVDIIVVHHSGHSMRKDAFDILKGSKVAVVVWIHNFLSAKHLSYYSRSVSVKRIVFVGKEFYNIYRDHPAIYKSAYIYNGIYIPTPLTPIPYCKRNNEVTYIGNLIEGKGFHLLAKAWKKVVKECPTAHLHVIGTGKLYDRHSKMGKFGLAEERYEKRFMKYLCDGNGQLLSSVTFHGIMGDKKNEIIDKTKVGVPNPSGNSETFGYTAIEMALRGSLITTIQCPGYLDTVPANGILYNSPDALAKSIVSLLKRDDNDYPATYNFIESNFSYRVISQKWHDMFTDILENKAAVLSDAPILYRFGALRERMRRLKATVPALNFLPTVASTEQSLHNIFSLSFYKKTARKIISTFRSCVEWSNNPAD